ncbi:MAG: hypothetical protein JXN64_01805 [Spirochaetes bacterium]|nr:hypothetical protein [Spirochaetota bacterium]
MYGNKTGNRRRGPDALTKAIGIFAGISWLLVFTAFVLVTYAKPRMATLFDRRYGGTGSQTLDQSLLMYANIVLVLVIIVCFIGFLINISRHKRKTDKFSASIIFFGVGSIIWLIYNLLSN